jgi:hypothetical protein
MPASDSSNMAMPLDEQLVAYLDGELDAEGSRRVEELLATDADARRRLQSMERTWEMLDDLDEAPAAPKFTQTTLEMVAVAARRDVEESLAEAPRRRRRRLWIVGGSLLGALAAGFLVVAMYATMSNRQLLADLPVLENFDAYRQIDSIEFLRLLEREKPFPADNDDAPRETTLKPEVPTAQRYEHVEKMASADKQDLVQAEEQFVRLDSEHQQRLHALHAAIQGDPDAERLRQIVQRYCDWTKSLSYSSRAELAELGPSERIEWIKKRFKEELAREGGWRLGGKDVDAMWKWMIECATRRQAQFLEGQPPTVRERLAKSSPELRYRAFIRATWPLGQAAISGKPPIMTDDDLTRLEQALSPEAREHFAGIKPADQWRVVSFWARQTLRAKRGPLSKDDDERLADFFEQLSPDERDRLLNLPGDEMQRTLLQLYGRQTRTTDGAGLRPDGQKGRRLGAPGFGNPGGKRPTPDKNGKESPPNAAP